ncbi:hypothetical protein [Actinophytocola sp.]|uniref:hypothetical protein n=1 Tax=Actinophytocola sp. TaxID=1872138 RepID=UPI00389A97C5
MDPSATQPDSSTTQPNPADPSSGNQGQVDDVGMQEPAAVPLRKADGWEVDSYRLRAFSDAVTRARSYLDAVQAKVNRMQGTELTPQLGTSPVGTQLAKKFDDRLNSADGLRAMLAEAMKRMDDFVTSAEDAARTYDEQEQSTADTFGKYLPESWSKRG